MFKRTLLAVTTALALTTAPAIAQQHQHGQGGMMDQESMMQEMHGSMMGGGMMRMMGASMHTHPAMLLRAAETLELTAEQKDELTNLRDRAQPERRQHMQAAMAAHQRAASALEGDAPDLDAYAEALSEAADHMVMAHVSMARVALDARELLTGEQLERLDEIMGAMHDGQDGMMGRDGGMMGGGMTGVEGGMMPCGMTGPAGAGAPSPDHARHH